MVKFQLKCEAFVEQYIKSGKQVVFFGITIPFIVPWRDYKHIESGTINFFVSMGYELLSADTILRKLKKELTTH